MTLVWTDKPGLEMLHEKEFHNVEAAEDGELYLICNIGDFLSSHMDGKVKSPWH